MAKEVDDSFHLDDGDYRKRTTKCLLFIAKVHGVVPTSFSCPDVRCQGKHAVWGGGFAVSTSSDFDVRSNKFNRTSGKAK